MAEIFEVKSKNGSTLMKYKLYDGLRMSLRVENVMERFEKLKTLKYKEGDVVIVTYPKTGTHWLMDSIAMLMNGKAEIVPQTASGFLDMISDLNALAAKDGPRIMETHLYPRHLSEDFISKGKFILGLRNPKDTAVSLFHHLKRANRHFLGNWDELIECILDGEGPLYGSFCDFYQSWQKLIESHEDQFLIVYYEDMHKDYRKQLERIANHLGIHLSGATLDAISKTGNMKTVKEELMKDTTVQEYAKTLTEDGSLPFYRKGIVGDWKNHFTVAQNEMFDEIIGKEIKTLNFKFDYTL